MDFGYSTSLERSDEPFSFRGHLQCVLLCCMMSALNVYFSNVRGYHQSFPELCASSLSLCPDIIALIETHLNSEPSQMKLPRGFVIAVHHDRSRHGSGILLLHRDDLLVDSVDCELYHVPTT